ncbi:hypothetical protein ALQ18_01179 [Pseudomonas marginalis pv. marginalis]|nr:hypothetical protein ALQ18_01179 [Pseudomonas marginalis pv. marginalis]
MRHYMVLIALVLFFVGESVKADERYLQGRLIQGPYKTAVVDGGELSVLETGDEEFPVSLVLDVIGADGVKTRQLVDKYDVAGSSPKVESIFFYPVKGKINVLTLVSWELTSRGDGTYGTLYQVFGYYKKTNNTLSANKLIEFDRRLGGIEGFQSGVPQSFKYKNAAAIKAYLKAQ